VEKIGQVTFFLWLMAAGLVTAFVSSPLAFAGSETASPILPQQNNVSAIPAIDRPPQPETKPENASGNIDPTSLDFMVSHPLTRPEAASDSKTEKTKTVIHFLTGIDMDRLARPADDTKNPFEGVDHPVSILVYEKGTTSGNTDNGSSQYEWRYSSGFKSSMVNIHITQGDEQISHTVLLETNREETWKAERDIQHASRLKEGKILSESYDIRYDLNAEGENEHAADHVITREVLRYVYDYSRGEKQLRSMSWTKYQDRLNATPRDIELHAVLIYDENGRPKQGHADKWNAGKKIKKLFDWHSAKSTLDFETRELWTMWEKWIKNGPAHVFIV